ncbi:hypothetical protein SKAU_G00341200 [Synaphobranchus kaupii]|uniref:Uncharacterized protein n=1 Tax=Synaphobranchus kaupii TaxID=118154 RepID=A0A9Q1EN51_SYNKA|nr:hypothetical protein SKAU_G00341200 [Synaphobranchus kaupii]
MRLTSRHRPGLFIAHLSQCLRSATTAAEDESLLKRGDSSDQPACGAAAQIAASRHNGCVARLADCGEKGCQVPGDAYRARCCGEPGPAICSAPVGIRRRQRIHRAIHHCQGLSAQMPFWSGEALL